MLEREQHPNEGPAVFGPFELFRTQRALFEHGRRVRLGGRALDILIALTDRSGIVVTKKELMTEVWPDLTVDEGNLRVHIAALRKVLGDGQNGVRYIVSVANRGYSFVTPVVRSVELPQQFQKREAPSLPAPPGRILGRESAIASVSSELAQRRLITIVGPGGVGKSRLALAVAEKRAEQNRHVCFVELAGIDDESQVPTVIATALGVSIRSDNPAANLVAFLSSQSLLIVLDNCEHVINVTASLVEQIVGNSSKVQILATSREPLRAREEWTYRLSGLGYPSTSHAITSYSALSYPAVQLFVERASTSVEGFDFDDADVGGICEICQRLDGIPLAIELVAARLDLFGINGLVNDLDSVLLVSEGRRTAQPRQQSLKATLDWSHELLSEAEKKVLRALAVFKGSFLLESACSVLADNSTAPNQVASSVLSLASKSLVATDASNSSVRYRLLLTTRSYAREKLKDSGELQGLNLRHADHYRVLLEASQTSWQTMSRAEWLNEYSYAIDDVRAALNWAFGEDGDIGIGASLTAASLPFGYQLSLVDESRRRAEVALAELIRRSSTATVEQVRLAAALCGLGINMVISPSSLEEAFARVTRLADQIETARDKIEPLLVQCFYRIECGDYQGAVEISDRLNALARKAEDPLAILLADRASAQTHFNAGDLDGAKEIAERVLKHPARNIPLIYSQASVDRRVSMRVVLARTLWLQGYSDSAVSLMDEGMELAKSEGPFAICQSLALGACPIALWTGDLGNAGKLIEQLVDYTRRYTLERWHRLGECFAFTLQELRKGSANSLGYSRPEPAGLMQREIVVSIDDTLITDEIVARADRGLSGWCAAEMLRAAGERELRKDPPNRIAAEEKFRQALKVAALQGAIFWELRAATSLARAKQHQNRTGEALDILQPVVSRFVEGFEMADFKRAKTLVMDLRSSL